MPNNLPKQPQQAVLFPQDETIYDVQAIRPYSLKELACFYGISKRTFRKWLQPFSRDIGPRNGRYYTVKQVELILHRLGIPYSLRGERA